MMQLRYPFYEHTEKLICNCYLWIKMQFIHWNKI